MVELVTGKFDSYEFTAEEVVELRNIPDLLYKLLLNERTVLMLQRANMPIPQGKEDEAIRTMEYLRGRIDTFNFLLQMKED